MIDHHNKFIKISLKLEEQNKEFIWLDSYRIFPVSLNDLCKQFKIEGKLNDYNSDYNDINKLLNSDKLLNEFKQYSLQDSKALFDCLKIAQLLYITNYKVDITSIVSSPSLSLKIFIQKFLNSDISILKGSVDRFVRKSYFGGHTDIYKKYIKKGKYYDINSLYPFAMLKQMPNQLRQIHKNMDNINLNDFFGFIKCEIITPDNILKPILPYKDCNSNRTIYPIGN